EVAGRHLKEVDHWTETRIRRARTVQLDEQRRVVSSHLDLRREGHAFDAWKRSNTALRFTIEGHPAARIQVRRSLGIVRPRQRDACCQQTVCLEPEWNLNHWEKPLPQKT